MKRFDLSLYPVLDPDLCVGIGMVKTALAAASGGATIIQLRDKQAGTAGRVKTGRALKAAFAETGALLIVNDDAEAAIAIEADGLHVRQNDMAARDARKQIASSMILGLSVATEELAAAVDPAIVDYAGIGPVFATSTKPDHKPPIGIDGVARRVRACRVPGVAIGGPKATHAEYVLAPGAKGLAVVSSICGTPDPRQAAASITDAIRKARA
ncbi:thiamine-phosphate pyrophosphorylase 1 (plasmid) [Rhizobium gallicum]|uniref:Thiamine-phosphate synthase n=1 Tax=Rhizobium gallicum TaxID=56730 RepID=A0A1L5NU82_9HYPH|nr:thiamine phosphate synthase [Rhizobium gallicum]APO71460.1 thiamine-phosphate pyrophosphorylase 1 [Rhizobium gallicum]